MWDNNPEKSYHPSDDTKTCYHENHTIIMSDITITTLDKNNYQEYIGDIEFLYKQFNQFYIDNNYNIYIDKKENSQIDFVKMITEDFEKENVLCFLSHKNKEPVGYILGYTGLVSEYFVTGFVSYIDGIYIAETARGFGLGKLLIEKFSNTMHKKYSAKIIRLNVKSMNKHAIKLYESIGFSVDEHRMYKVLP